MRSTPGVRWIGTSPGAGAFAWAPSRSLAPSSLRSRLAPQCEVDPRDTRWEIPHPQPQPPPCPDRRQLADARTRPAGRRRPCPRPSRSRAARVHWPSGGPVDSTDDRGSGSCRRRCICHQKSRRRAWVIRAERVPGVDAAAPQELEWPGCWGEWPGPAGCAGAGATAWVRATACGPLSAGGGGLRVWAPEGVIWGAAGTQGREALSVCAGHRPAGWPELDCHCVRIYASSCAPSRIRTCAHGSGGRFPVSR